MLIDFNQEMIETGIKHVISSRANIAIDTIYIGSFNVKDLVNGEFKDNPFGNESELFLLPVVINGVLVQEIIEEKDFIFSVYRAFIENELGIKKFSIEEMFPSEKADIIQTVNFYID